MAAMYKYSAITKIFIFVLFAAVNTASGQTRPTKFEKEISNSLNSLFLSLQTSGNPEEKTLEEYGGTIIQKLKGFNKFKNNISTNSHTYSKTIKIKKDLFTIFIAFEQNIYNKSEFYIHHFILGKSSKLLDSIYFQNTAKNFGKRIGRTCNGNDIYFNKFTQGYIELKFNETRTPDMLIYPQNFTVQKSEPNFDAKLIPFHETIIYDNSQVLEPYTKMIDSLNANKNFTSDPFGRNSFDLNFIHLIEKEVDEYLTNNLDALQENPNVEKFLSAIDSLKRIKQDELNIRWFTINIPDKSSVTKNQTSYIGMNIMLYRKEGSREKELEVLKERLMYCTELAKINNINSTLGHAFNKISLDARSRQFEITDGNYLIKIFNTEGFYHHWQFHIELKACK